MLMEGSLGMRHLKDVAAGEITLSRPFSSETMGLDVD